MKSDSLTDQNISALGRKVQEFTRALSPLEQAYMAEILTRAGAAKAQQDRNYVWSPDPVLALRVSLRSRSGIAAS